MELLKKIKDKATEYDSKFEEIILKFTVGQGGKAGTTGEEATFEQGKYFATKFEIFMYAVMLGLRNDYRLAFAPKAKKISFQYYMKHWTPVDLVDYIVMGTLSKSDIDFNALENKNEKEVDEEILKLRKLIEEYANGGFDKIRAKLESEPNFFDNNDNCFIDLLDEKTK
ncbi:MAG: hypothetical protein IPG01_12715 [Chitinophagaceae bacterium]|nr:hypothetical protein [Chitinophagaceae bacterium]